eukprot:m.7843 g.7843  ORF g.7843 m.7843 type:complete len:641 (+) comp3790_c0_seq2:198-2120(+)
MDYRSVGYAALAAALLTVTPCYSAKNRTVGILYSTWHGALGANKMNTPGYGKLGNHTVEWVISNQSPGGPTIDDLSAFYHSTPKLGFYCIYRRRNGEGPPNGGECPICPIAGGHIPACCRDCPNIPETLRAHASMLVSAGIDYIATDATNLFTWPSNESDIIQLRPTEVLFEEWYNLRQQGVKTPRVVVWNCVPTNATLWIEYLSRIYNNASYADLIQKNPKTGKYVFAVVNNSQRSPDPKIVQQIQSNNGRNNIDVIYIWADNPATSNLEGQWNFFAPCGGSRYTTSVVQRLECNQQLTPTSIMGSSIAVSPSYQVGAGTSMPFGSPGKLSGFTLKLGFATALNTMPDNIFLSSFNELLAGPTAGMPLPDGHPPGFVLTAGMEYAGPPTTFWVDTYGAYRSRDLEPTLEYGSVYLDIVASCLRVYERNSLLGINGCTMDNETCCDLEGSRIYQPLWSLATWKGKEDYLLTSASEEKLVLTVPGSKWYEVCVALARSQDDFCYDSRVGATSNGLRGPFLVRTVAEAGYTALYRCTDNNNGVHFFATSSDCDTLGKAESILGYVANTRSTDMARSLRRCAVYDTRVNESLGYMPPSIEQLRLQNISQEKPANLSYHYYHTLDSVCNNSQLIEGTDILGYVF